MKILLMFFLIGINVMASGFDITFPLYFDENNTQNSSEKFHYCKGQSFIVNFNEPFYSYTLYGGRYKYHSEDFNNRKSIFIFPSDNDKDNDLKSGLIVKYKSGKTYTFSESNCSTFKIIDLSSL